MQSVPREWLVFLREQYPKDSRIRLTEMGADPRPLPPGSTGKLDFIDDAGQFHVKWDNGRTLALVLGKDRFSIYPPEPQTLKLYMPITADFYGRDEWGDMSEYGEEWDGRTLMDHEGSILSALVKNWMPESSPLLAQACARAHAQARQPAQEAGRLPSGRRCGRHRPERHRRDRARRSALGRGGVPGGR